MSNKKWKNRDALVTVFDESLGELIKIIVERTTFLNRLKDTSMAHGKESENVNSTDREGHVWQVAAEAKEIAKELGLNEVVVFIGMLLHDTGQPFFAHDGEKIVDAISQILNTGFYHHTAKGVDVVLREDIIKKIIDAFPEAENNEELREKMKNDVWYFLELIVGHDGESTSKDNKKYAKSKKKYSSIKESVLDKVAKANITNKYKCAVETLEAQISKPADILAYMRSDVLDGFYNKILTGFSNEYLELVGKLLDETTEETLVIEEKIKNANPQERENIISEVRKNRISKAKELVESIKLSKLKLGIEEVSNEEQEIYEEVKSFVQQLKDCGIDPANIEEDKLEEVEEIKERIKENYKKRKLAEGKNENIVKSQVNKLENYMKKVQETRKRVVEEIMTQMQSALRNDYIQTTKKRWEEIEADESLSDEERYELKKQAMGFSDKVNEIIYGSNGIKDLNYREYVQFAKKKYLTGCLPKRTLKLILTISKMVKDTGVIKEKFFDPEVFGNIGNQELIGLMHKNEIDNESNNKVREEIGLIKNRKVRFKKIRELKAKFTGNINRQKKARNSLCRSIYRHAMEYPQGFARVCEEVYEAIPYTVRNMVEKAVRSDYEENAYLPEEERERVYEIRAELAKRFGEYGGVAITKENLEKYIEEQIEKERDSIEEKVAIQICIDYIAGRSNKGIQELLDRTGILSKKEIEKEDILNEEGNRVVQELSAKLRSEAGENTEETQEEFRKRMKNHKVSPLFVIDEGFEK